MRERVAAATSAELHLHLEGAFDPRLALRLSETHEDLPPAPIDTGGERPRWRYSDFLEFIQCFAWGTRLLRGPREYVALLDVVAQTLRSENTVYAELFVAFGQMRRAEVDSAPVLKALARRAEEIEAEGGPSLWFIADVTRQWGPREAGRALDAALRVQDCRIVGFGMGGDESAIRAREFREVYRRAERAGLGLSCHAGEGTTPDAVREAVEELGVRRIGHGIAAAEDPRLLRELAEDRVLLEVCPTSNERTGVWHLTDGDHPLHRILEAGASITLGSDDPAFFECTLAGEVERCRSWGLDEATLELCARNAFDAAFASAARTQRRRVEWGTARESQARPDSPE